jgi:hypothetical protein
MAIVVQHIGSCRTVHWQNVGTIWPPAWLPEAVCLKSVGCRVGRRVQQRSQVIYTLNSQQPTTPKLQSRPTPGPLSGQSLGSSVLFPIWIVCEVGWGGGGGISLARDSGRRGVMPPLISSPGPIHCRCPLPPHPPTSPFRKGRILR